MSANLKYSFRIDDAIVMLWHKRKKVKDSIPEQD